MNQTFKKLRINDFFNYTDGLFQLLTKKYNTLFFNTRSPTLDFDFLNRFGEHYINRNLQKAFDRVGVIIKTRFYPVQIDTDELLTIQKQEFRELLLDDIAMHYEKKWNDLYKALTTEYNPIENYAMTEEENINQKGTDKETIDQSQVVDQTQTSNNDNQVDDHQYRSSFDNESQQQTGYTSQQGNSTTTDTNKSTNTNKGTNDRTSEQSNNRTLKRSGNIGVTTSQQMLESELKLREYDLYETIYKDVLKLISIPYLGSF